jgi:hypothetical protein
MALDSDVSNADSQLYVEFYEHDKAPYKGEKFIRIQTPGDKTTTIETIVREHHKERFPRQWLYYQMQNNENIIIGLPVVEWHKERPEEISEVQLAELQILKFQTVDQVATASDSQIQRIGMGGTAMRERAKAFLASKGLSKQEDELSKTRMELEALKEQMSILMEERKPRVGRPRKELTDGDHDASVGAASYE